jgi:hypothetical protein
MSKGVIRKSKNLFLIWSWLSNLIVLKLFANLQIIYLSSNNYEKFNC